MSSKVWFSIATAIVLGACSSSQQASAPPPAPPPAPSATPQTYTVLFATGSSALSSQSMSTIAQAAAAAKSSGGPVSLTGHTDTVGGADYNMTLSQNRAEAVSKALVQNGVPASSIAPSAVGESSLIVPTADQVAEQQNRAVTISVMVARASSGGMDDQTYCKLLSAKYRDYARAGTIQPAAAEAMHQCDIGNAAAAIPVLSQYLTDGKVPLPPRG